MIKVAIITRTKDRPVFLARAIQSVANQIYKDYVHVIVNDGGESGEVEDIIQKLPEDIQEKIQLFHRENPSGAPDTIFNESIDRVESEYFAIHDDDDTWHPRFLRQTVQYLDDNKKLGAVVVRTDKVTEELTNGFIREKKRLQYMPDVKVVNLYRQCADNQLTPIATLFRRSAYEEVGKFDNTLPVVGDWEFGVRLLMSYDVGFIDPGFALASYHHRAGARNSFSEHSHREYTNKVMNQYLRQDLAAGNFGLGYIMNDLRDRDRWVSGLVKNILPSSMFNKIKKRVRR